MLTFEEMFLQAAPGHELVDDQPVLVLVAVADQFHEVRMPQLPQEDDLGLHGFGTEMMAKSVNCKGIIFLIITLLLLL